MDIKGKIHSIETFATSDGPGIRFVVFTQGCLLRCQYCHNPDTWKMNEGKEVTVEELMMEIVKYKTYMKSSGGGITVSGGEPLMQINFTKELLKNCKDKGIHTAIDTSGYVNIDKVKDVLDYADLVLLDIKSFNHNTYRDITGALLDSTINFCEYLSYIRKPTWIRYVLVPGLTDKYEDIDNLAKFLSKLENIERVDILPFHKMGEYKWEQLGYNYELWDVLEPCEDEVEKAKEIFRKYDLNVK